MLDSCSGAGHVTTGSIIFARYESTRLPGKALLDIGGKCMLAHVIDRAVRIGDYPVVVATSRCEADDAIVKFSESRGVHVFRGALDDVADRGLACARAFGFKYFARICGDRPYFDPEVVRLLIERAENDDLDLATNVGIKSFPPGMTAEVILVDALDRVLKITNDAKDREHLTRYFYREPDAFRIFNLESNTPRMIGVSLVVDTPEDIDRARFIAARLPDPIQDAACEDIINLARAWMKTRGKHAKSRD